MNYTIDAKGKSIGRVATEAAILLMGKNKASFKRNLSPEVSVRIENASLAKIGPQKEGKRIKSYSGYPGGLKEETILALGKRRGFGQVFRHAIKGMLPKNKLQAKMLKNLTITE